VQKISIEDIAQHHIFCDVYGLAQKWADGESWSFIGSPRADHGFMYILCDEVCIRYKDGGRATFSRGNLLYIPKDSEYYVEFHTTKAEDFQDILVNFLIRDFLGHEFCLADEIICLMSETSPAIANDFYKIAEFSTNIKNPYLRVTKAFYGLLEKLLAHVMLFDAGNKSKGTVAPALFYIDNHIGDNISVEKLAKMCLLSESTFRKAFKSSMGMSPAQYKILVKIHKAQSILESTPEMSIAEIADSLGFYDISYFYKTFVRITGKTPKRYRDEK